MHWSQVLSREWRCSYIWVIDNFIAYQGVAYIRDLTVIMADGLVMQAARVSAAILLTWIAHNIPISAPGELICKLYFQHAIAS